MLQSNDLLNVTVLMADPNRCHVSRGRKAHLFGLQNQCLQHIKLFLRAEMVSFYYQFHHERDGSFQ